MQSGDKLMELIEQAASSINMLNSEDLSELESLQAIFDQINQSVTEITDGSAELLEQAKEATSNSVEVLKKILKQEADDTEKSIELVSTSVCSLQSVIGKMVRDTSAADSVCPAPVASEDTEAGTQAGAAILEDDIPLILDFIAEAAEHIDSAEAGLLELESKPDDEDTINQIFRGFHTIKGMAGFLNLSDIGSLAHSAENLLDLARKGELVLAGANTDVVFESMDMMKKMIAELKESTGTGTPVPAQKGLPQLLAKLKATAEGQTLADPLDTPHGQKKDKELDEVLITQPKPKIEDIATKAKTTISGDEKIKVSTERLDKLVNMTGELVIAQLMVDEEVDKNLTAEHELGRKVSHQGKIIRELQELSMSMRMVPIHGVFQKMTRLVRDLSHKANKKIDFITSGEETELDRNIVDKIADPLVHMVRNSVDHGIESAQERSEAGKSPTGRIELRAFHQAGNIVIEIEDDGKGLDKERILKKAVDNGIVEVGRQLSDEEIFKLIFHAGLSTAQKVTSVSGRGVGMDVVKKNIESLRGKVDISSTPGRGTTFTVRMPLTLAIIDGQVVKIGNNRYIIPINSIVRSLKPTAEQISSVQNRGEMVMVRGRLIPLIRLYKLFDIVPASEDATESLLVVVEEENDICCLLVDELLGQQQVVIKNLGEGLGKIKGVSGGAIMGDGNVSLILDVPGLMELAQK
ncbi:MAG: chemotaxis protein CheA [Planctomycetota bacterium]|nr:MAG: chemotaxis protein CheA [Planctomycetota bacterium]